MLRQFKNEAHRRAVTRAATAASIRARMLHTVQLHARASDPSDAEVMRLRALALCRQLLTAERIRYNVETPKPTKTKTP
jgi:hypothetical protein